MGMIQFPTVELRIRRLIAQAYATRTPFRARSTEGRLLLTEDGCTARDLRGLMLEEAVGRCLVRAVNRRIVSSDVYDEPTCVFPEDAMAMLVHAALLELLNRVPRRAAAASLKVIAAAIEEGTEDLREVVLATLDDAVHGYPIK